METAAEATTVKRKKSAGNEVLGMAVERGHFTHNLLNGSRWTAPQVAAEVDPERISPGRFAQDMTVGWCPDEAAE
ncbi:hypothetical protein [Streptomyces sp. NPDC059256]|uniref:hypothetical protein n=1 Tax=Streptomyces sp. NPDC059256 TaxID=3346794 RepID=UPI00369D908F